MSGQKQKSSDVMMFFKSTFRTLKLLAVVFPIAAGLFLTGLGWVRLNEATEPPRSKPLAPYGILVFSSQECEHYSLAIFMDEIDVKGNMVDNHFLSLLVLKPQNSLCEETFGFQIPYYVELSKEISVTASDASQSGEVELDVLDKNAIFAGDLTSIIYVKFMVSPESQEYDVDIRFTWLDIVIKTAFSTYDIMVPFSVTTHNIVHEHLSNINLLDFSSIDLSMRLPEDSEFREALPPPDEEVIHSSPESGGFRPARFLTWRPPVELFRRREAPFPISETIRVRFELREESDLRGRLFFDSGLYMGLGVSLIFGGIHEALKIAEELKRKQTK